MGFVAPFLSGGLGTALGVAGAVGQFAVSQAQARQQASLNKYNAELSKREAAQEAEKQKQRYGEMANSKRSSYAASGISLDSGSVLDNLAAIDAEGEVNAQKALFGGANQAAKYQMNAVNAVTGANTRLFSGIGSLLR